MTAKGKHPSNEIKFQQCNAYVCGGCGFKIHVWPCPYCMARKIKGDVHNPKLAKE